MLINGAHPPQTRIQPIQDIATRAFATNINPVRPGNDISSFNMPKFWGRVA